MNGVKINNFQYNVLKRECEYTNYNLSILLISFDCYYTLFFILHHVC